jgi:hypothetical protein
MTTTNASSASLAAHLAAAKVGSFVGLITQKQGVTRGRGAAKMVYGDDTVHTVIVTGFRYDRLVERSLTKLVGMNPADVLAAGLVDGDGNPITMADVHTAMVDLATSLQASADGTNTSSTDHVYEPLVVDGDTVRGCRVYKCVAGNPAHDCKCRDCTGEEKAPKSGTIYLQGLAIGTKVITPAPNGPAPASKSRADVVAKNWIRARLPIGRYVSYRLEAGESWMLAAGGVAAAASDTAGITLRTDMVADIEAMSAAS